MPWFAIEWIFLCSHFSCYCLNLKITNFHFNYRILWLEKLQKRDPIKLFKLCIRKKGRQTSGNNVCIFNICKNVGIAASIHYEYITIIKMYCIRCINACQWWQLNSDNMQVWYYEKTRICNYKSNSNSSTSSTKNKAIPIKKEIKTQNIKISIERERHLIKGKRQKKIVQCEQKCTVDKCVHSVNQSELHISAQESNKWIK